MAHPKPVIDQRAAEQMNLNVLKRMDPHIEELLATAGHVALYDFDIPTKRWVRKLRSAVQSRKDVEGSLFLVKRRGQPRFQFIILNKKSAVGTDNFVEDVHGGFQCEVQKPYVLYRNKANEVVGIWFYDDADCDRISALLQRIASTFAAPTEALAGAAAPVAPDVELDAAAVAASENDSSATKGDDGFWDRRLTVPDDAASSLQQSMHQQANGYQQQQTAAAMAARAALLVPSQMQQPAAAAEPMPAASVPAAALGSSNDLVRLFAGIKVGTAAAFAAPAPVAAPVAGEAAPAAAAPVMLLTPQLLQQEAASVPAAVPVPSSQAPAASEAATAGNVLLQSLLRGSSQQQLQQSASAAKAAQMPVPHPVDITEAADRALRSKVSSLLQSLANNEDFCSILASELKRAGLV